MLALIATFFTAGRHGRVTASYDLVTVVQSSTRVSTVGGVTATWWFMIAPWTTAGQLRAAWGWAPLNAGEPAILVQSSVSINFKHKKKKKNILHWPRSFAWNSSHWHSEPARTESNSANIWPHIGRMTALFNSDETLVTWLSRHAQRWRLTTCPPGFFYILTLWHILI